MGTETSLGEPARVIAILLALGASSCTATDWSFSPLSSRASREQASESWGLGPFLESRELPEDQPDVHSGRAVVQETALRPFFRKYRTIDRLGQAEEVLQILYPLWQARRTDELSEWRFLWLWWYRDRWAVDTGEREWDLFAPPFFAGGGESDDEDYFALLPLFGKIRDFAVFDQLLFVLFPLYYQARKNVREAVTFHNITPLIGWTDGGPKDGSHRILPLYSRAVHEGRYERWSFLWPIFHWHRDRLDQEDPSRLLTIWPLFSIDRSERHRFLGLLWPFFRFRQEHVPAREFEGEELRAAANHYHHDAPWPLIRFQKTREFERQRVFPLYSRYRSADLDSDAFLIPLFWLREERSAHATRRSFDVAPLFRREVREYHDGRPRDTNTRLWPLFEHVQGGDGERRLRFPILVPSDANRGFRELAANLDPLIELYHDHRRPDGSRRLRALFHLLDYRRDGEHSRFSIPLLYSNQLGPERHRHDLLWGLIRFGSGVGGPELRLFFLPLLRPEEPGP